MNHPSRKPRPALVLVCVLVCMGIASTILLASVRTSLRARRQMRSEIQLEQTRWLLEAGIVRGMRKLRADDDYTGETWHVDPALARFAQARVEIRVRHAATSADTARVDVVAQIGQEATNAPQTRRSRSVRVASEGTD